MEQVIVVLLPEIENAISELLNCVRFTSTGFVLLCLISMGVSLPMAAIGTTPQLYTQFEPMNTCIPYEKPDGNSAGPERGIPGISGRGGAGVPTGVAVGTGVGISVGATVGAGAGAGASYLPLRDGVITGAGGGTVPVITNVERPGNFAV